jgi:Peptidase S46
MEHPVSNDMKTASLTATVGFTLIGLALLNPIHLRADEGMWLFNDPPRALLKQRYGFEPTDAWLDHLQKSSVRFNNGGSGSFVSEDGLVLSNHHVGADALQKFGDETHNYLRDGFQARTLAEEKRCLDLELNVLMSIEDVTERVNAAVKEGLSPAEAFAARRAVMATIEKESFDRTGLRSDVITLYQGGRYHLYRYKKYTDVRLVFAPEQQIAFFGGDPDNFEYPRYCLDICLFRVYEDGKPARVGNYLKWSKAGAGRDELVFVSGNPGRTSRLLTMAELEYVRDQRLPQVLDFIKGTEVLLSAWSGRSAENARRAREDLFGFQNARKAYDGSLAGLLDPELLASKQEAEATLRRAVQARPELAKVNGAWDHITAAQGIIAEHALRYNWLERGRGFRSDLFSIARTLLRAAEELPKPNAERLREFGEAGLESLKFQLFSEKPIYDDLERLQLADSLTRLTSEFGYTNELIQTILAGKSPRQRAAELIAGTTLKSVIRRKELFEGGLAAINAAHDPMIELARAIDPASRAVRKIVEAEDEAKRQAHAGIAKARFAIEGTSRYPDATFTLRLAFGTVRGYEENGGQIPFETAFTGLYERAARQDQRPPFDLPERWVKGKRKLDLKTPLNFVSTVDIIGGNSGSPVVNRAGEFVGIIFDGNLESLAFDFQYTDKKARAISVHSQGILEALRKIYNAGALANELVTGHRKH